MEERESLLCSAPTPITLIMAVSSKRREASARLATNCLAARRRKTTQP